MPPPLRTVTVDGQARQVACHLYDADRAVQPLRVTSPPDAVGPDTRP